MGFKVYDSEMNEVRLPGDTYLHYGSYPLKLEISGFDYEKRGRKTVVTGRQALIRGFIISSDPIDMDMKMSNVYAFFRRLGEFYVAKESEPFKLLKVEANQSYTLESENNGVLTEFEIPLTVQKPYFKQSLHTTLDIDSEGIRFNDKWGYGMGLSSDSGQWKYSFINTDPYFYNAGTEEVKLIKQKESEITLIFNGSTLNGLVDIDDGITTFKLFRNVVAGDVLRIKGHQITLNGDNVAGDTNRQFLTVKRGWNNWDVRGVTDFEFKIDYRYLYD
ncbi:phage tail family protein [Salinicoccus carnicancri]|uniref:phage tail family protein n=1 Tax=Salinicoccus carnicancri TaxID=558170 RepID=UPI0002EE9529|nr:phage tail family protein [Salinicoccus carnicancri]